MRMIIIAVMIVFSGCATLVDVSQERFNALPQHYSQFDMKMAWNTKTTDAGTVINGMVKNVRYLDMVDVEVWVSLLDGSGKTLGRASTFILPISLKKYDTAAFSLTLPVKAVEGTKLQFTYRYRAPDDLDDSGFWMQSFEIAEPATL